MESVCLFGMTYVSSYCYSHVFIDLKAFLFSYPLTASQEVIFHVLYRHPSVLKAQFLDDFGLFLEGVALSSSKHILLGDLNFHLDKQDSWSKQFNDVLKQYSFAQIINSPLISVAIFWMFYALGNLLSPKTGHKLQIAYLTISQ